MLGFVWVGTTGTAWGQAAQKPLAWDDQVNNPWVKEGDVGRVRTTVDGSVVEVEYDSKSGRFSVKVGDTALSASSWQDVTRILGENVAKDPGEYIPSLFKMRPKDTYRYQGTVNAARKARGSADPYFSLRTDQDPVGAPPGWTSKSLFRGWNVSGTVWTRSVTENGQTLQVRYNNAPDDRVFQGHRYEVSGAGVTKAYVDTYEDVLRIAAPAGEALVQAFNQPVLAAIDASRPGATAVAVPAVAQRSDAPRPATGAADDSGGSGTQSGAPAAAAEPPSQAATQAQQASAPAPAAAQAASAVPAAPPAPQAPQASQAPQAPRRPVVTRSTVADKTRGYMEVIATWPKEKTSQGTVSTFKFSRVSNLEVAKGVSISFDNKNRERPFVVEVGGQRIRYPSYTDAYLGLRMSLQADAKYGELLRTLRPEDVVAVPPPQAVLDEEQANWAIALTEENYARAKAVGTAAKSQGDENTFNQKVTEAKGLRAEKETLTKARQAAMRVIEEIESCTWKENTAPTRMFLPSCDNSVVCAGEITCKLKVSDKTKLDFTTAAGCTTGSDQCPDPLACARQEGLYARGERVSDLSPTPDSGAAFDEAAEAAQ